MKIKYTKSQLQKIVNHRTFLDEAAKVHEELFDLAAQNGIKQFRGKKKWPWSKPEFLTGRPESVVIQELRDTIDKMSFSRGYTLSRKIYRIEKKLNLMKVIMKIYETSPETITLDQEEIKLLQRQ
jgi:hypothetical protein